MDNRRYSIPSTSALVAFECAARHLNFTRAAEELNTSQSAISRHIADLEGRLGVRLFERSSLKMLLTVEGEMYHRAIVSGLETIQSAAAAIGSYSQNDQLVIACTHEISHLLLMPRFEDLQNEVGADIEIRIMTYDYDILEKVLDPRIDLMFSYQKPNTREEDQVHVFRESVTPVCSPAFAEENAATLKKPCQEWGSLPFLQLTKRNKGWATWDDWFERHGAPLTTPEYLRFEN